MDEQRTDQPQTDEAEVEGNYMRPPAVGRPQPKRSTTGGASGAPRPTTEEARPKGAPSSSGDAPSGSPEAEPRD